MLADFMAYTEHVRHTRMPTENPLTEEEVAALQSHATKEQKARLSYLSLGREELGRLSEHFADLRRSRNDAERRKRQSKNAKDSSEGRPGL
jgi:hypothetical protein